MMRRPWTGDTESLVECSVEPGSCGLCLMDYEIAIESSLPAAAGGGPKLMSEESFTVTVKTYHNLGECRKPDDWKWARFTESCRPHLFFPNRPNRRGSTTYPGTVKKKWRSDVGEDVGKLIKDADEAQGKKQVPKFPFELPAFTVGKVHSKSGRGAVVVKVEALEL